MIVDPTTAVYAALALSLLAALLSMVLWHELSRRVRDRGHDDGHARAERREMRWYGGFHNDHGKVLSPAKRGRS
jgi:hypothetical protein